MSNRILDDGDHVSRYCNPRTIDNGIPSGMAFMMRQSDSYLSVNWLECFREQNFASAIVKVREALRSIDFDLKLNGKFAIINIQDAKRAGLKTSNNLRIECFDEVNNKSHSGIFGYTYTDLEIAEELARHVKPDELHPGINNIGR